MGWETINGRRYFYEATYVDGERVRRCHGYGTAADHAAARVEQEKLTRARDQARLRELEIHDQRVDMMVSAFHAAVHQTIQHSLNRAGYHFLRGQWRKKRKIRSK